MTDTKHKGGRKRTGTVITLPDGRKQGIITLPSGRRHRLKPFPRGTSDAYAEEKTAHYSENPKPEWDAPPAVTAPELGGDLEDNPMGKWVAVWNADRVARGYTSTRDHVSHYRLHIRASLGTKHVKDWTPADLRKLSRDLDAKVQAKGLAWKTAQNVWGTATKMCDDATESKRDEIRCRAENPAVRVRGPDSGIEKEPQFLYPTEFLKLVECSEVPLRWRRAVAVAVYTYGRDAELRVLECADADLEHGIVRFTKALDKRSKPARVKSTKGKRNRTIPVEAPIVPLLAMLKGEREAKDRLFASFPSERDMARGLRRWLKRAGVSRHELHHDTETTAKLRFHDLRATGITWMAVRGDDALKIQRRAGHKDLETTQRYIRTAEDHRAGFGSVFPPLPPELYETPEEPISDEQSIGAIDRDSVTNELICVSSGADGTRKRPIPEIAEENAREPQGQQGQPPTLPASNPVNVGARSIENDRLPSHNASPRAALVASLTESLRNATSAGDLAMARIVHEALGRLLAEPEPGAPTVANLNEERAKRKR